MVQSLADHMGKAFPELHDSPAYGKKNIERVVELFRDEEASFGKTLTPANQVPRLRRQVAFSGAATAARAAGSVRLPHSANAGS